MHSLRRAAVVLAVTPLALLSVSLLGEQAADAATPATAADIHISEAYPWWSDDTDDDSHWLRTAEVDCTPLTAGHVGSTIAASVSGTPHHGWYRTPVTVTFGCATTDAVLTAPCPARVRLAQGRHRTASGSITDTLGLTHTASKTVNIDTTKPRVRIAGVRARATYDGVGPRARCVATDALSGVASCRLTTRRTPSSVRVTATATDRAGNTATTTLTYRTRAVSLSGAGLRHGVWKVRSGQRYTLVVLSTSRTAPRYLAPGRGHLPGGRGTALHARGVVGGVHVWKLSVRLHLPRKGTYELAVKQGGRLTVVRVAR